MSNKYADRSRVVKAIFIVVGILFVGRLAMLQLFDPKYRSLEQVLIDFHAKRKFNRFSVFLKGVFTEKDTVASDAVAEAEVQETTMEDSEGQGD